MNFTPPMFMPRTHDIFAALTARYSLSARASQIALAEHIRTTLSTPGAVCCIEAPTGTGKTLGYLAGALDAQAHAANPAPVVVATATVGLQEQILRDDIPRLAAIGAVDARKVAVAKGRGRYFCPRTAVLLEDKKEADAQHDLFDTSKPLAEPGVPIALEMLHAWRTKRWDGDRDSWKGMIPQCWEAHCAASGDTCVNQACAHFNECPYLISRARLTQAQLIIANHDIVLADLAQRADEQATAAIPVKSYALIVDEAHNLPDKAIRIKTAKILLLAGSWAAQIEPYLDEVDTIDEAVESLARANETPAGLLLASAGLAAGLEALGELLADLKYTNGLFSWGLKRPPEEVLATVVELTGQTQRLLNGLQLLTEVLAELAERNSGVVKGFLIHLLTQTHQLRRELQSLHKFLELFCSDEELVRWVQRNTEGRSILHAQPLEGRDVLNEILWPAGVSVAMVSATLQIGGSFKRFQDKTGLPDHALTTILPPVFDYSRGFLHLPTMLAEPSDATFEAEVTDKLGRLYDANVARGMLVLFTSREQLRRVVPDLPDHMRPAVLAQDSKPLPELIAAHKARINAGQRSVLVGLDSMAEGLDLPGNYCGHVVITRLPFSVPGNPVEAARQELLGKSWFRDAYLADMITMLIQSVGRLIRRESDTGVVTVLDRRLVNKGYNKQVIAALPGFSRGTRIADFTAQVLVRGFATPL